MRRSRSPAPVRSLAGCLASILLLGVLTVGGTLYVLAFAWLCGGDVGGSGSHPSHGHTLHHRHRH